MHITKTPTHTHTHILKYGLTMASSRLTDVASTLYNTCTGLTVTCLCLNYSSAGRAIGPELDDRVPGVQFLARARVFPLSQSIQKGFGGHLWIKQSECEAVGTCSFGAYFMDVFKCRVLAPYTTQ